MVRRAARLSLSVAVLVVPPGTVSVLAAMTLRPSARLSFTRQLPASRGARDAQGRRSRVRDTRALVWA